MIVCQLLNTLHLSHHCLKLNKDLQYNKDTNSDKRLNKILLLVVAAPHVTIARRTNLQHIAAQIDAGPQTHL